jgi:UDP-N-acetylmuramoyl-L-alanyl-D-glutamate--2,6-diaminopimelate ligase
MKWQELINSVETEKQGGNSNPEITDIAYDSRSVIPGAAFFAIPGYKEDGSWYIDDAINNGAVAVVSEKEQKDCTVPWIQVAEPRRLLSAFALKLWDIRFENIVTVGITGTNGKTTTVGLYHNLFQNMYGNTDSWMFSTVVYNLGNKTVNATKTTPEASDLLRFIKESDYTPKAITMEVSSHALELHRVDGFMFDIVVWTNLTQDHLDFHGDMNSYYEAKKKLFINNQKDTGITVINIDDKWGQKLFAELSDTEKVTYGFSDSADVKVVNSSCTWSGTKIAVQSNNDRMHFMSSLVGEFNIYNMAALIAGALALGISEEVIRKSFDSMPVMQGRMERVKISADFSVVVDYAHTPDALKNVLTTARNLTNGKLICVFGCGGDRDKVKRPLMAEAVVANCDEMIVTTDNPRTESPKQIIDDILEGVPLDFPYSVIVDRREAIKKALQIGEDHDCIVIAGKGHETYQEVNGIRHHFDDREVVLELSKEMERTFGKK